MQDMQESWVPSLGQEPLEEEMATHSMFLPGKAHGRRRLVGYSPWGYKESHTIERARTHTYTQNPPKGAQSQKL